jgi:hypothetical protein
MTLEDIGALFGEPVELSFEQALKKEGVNIEHEDEEKAKAEQLESISSAA